MLSWTGEGSFELNGTSFRTLPPVDLLEEHPMDLGEREFFVFKPVEEVESYIALVRALEPQRILELGVFGGGSTMLLAEIARPRRIAAIDLTPLAEVEEKVARAVAASDLDPATISLHGGSTSPTQRRWSGSALPSSGASRSTSSSMTLPTSTCRRWPPSTRCSRDCARAAST
ncbi:MAG: hypothetical protein KDB58_10550 [Solirubrobacterales bacterium]|nr:hypothetical protein [Solirubrobacterales bacterium]MCB8971241.1 hypothetical protein [Thermoleophilales bacterium]MCO5325904.1 hypothetical protein [Solirubrobacterales bacterium]